MFYTQLKIFGFNGQKMHQLRPYLTKTKNQTTAKCYALGIWVNGTHFIELNHWLKEPLIFTVAVELVVIVWVWVMLA